jgi:hypothetical protein
MTIQIGHLKMKSKSQDPIMWFAVSPYAPDLHERLLRCMQEVVAANPALRLYALVDTALDEAFLKKYRANHLTDQTASLYAGTELDAVADVSPVLVPLSCEPALRLKTLLRLADGKPMLSFLASPLALEPLKTHFLPFLEVETEDGEQLVLRFADTRILPVLFTTLDHMQQSALLSPIAHWWSIDRMGDLCALPLPAYDPATYRTAAAPFQVLPLSDRQFAAMVDWGEADSIIEQLRLIAPEQCDEFEPGTLHQFISEQLQHAQSFGVEGTPERVAYCIGAFNTQGMLHENAHVKTLLKNKLWRLGDLAGALGELPEECWI